MAHGKPENPLKTAVAVHKASKKLPDKKPVIQKAVRQGIKKSAETEAPKPVEVSKPSFGLSSFTTDAPTELKVSTPKPAPQKHPEYEDAVLFLRTLGLKEAEARSSLDKIRDQVTPEHPVSELVRLALKTKA